MQALRTTGAWVGLGLAAAAWGAGAAFGATTDIRAIRTIITDGPACSGVPIENEPVCISVWVQNLGPDPYNGTGSAPNGSRGFGVEAAPALRISVDIDEPTKPGLPWIQATFTQDFAVNIAPGDSVQLNFGQVGLMLASGVHAARMTATAQAPNVDPNPANNMADNTFSVLSIVPAGGWAALLALALGLGGVAALASKRLRRRAV